jgi:hypothetical protein
MSRNFTTDVDTQREYYNAAYFNNSGQTQQAKYSTTLLKPLLKDTGNWKLAINRMRIPLSGIPLTKKNIPFQSWLCGINYTTSATDTGYSGVSNVKQYGQYTQSDYISISINNNLEWEQWIITQGGSELAPDNVNTPLNDATTVNSAGKFVSPAQTPQTGAYTFALSATNPNNINVYEAFVSQPIYTINTSSYGCSEIMSITADENFNVYFAYKNSAGTPLIASYLANQAGTVWAQSTTYGPPAGSGTMRTCTSISWAVGGGYFVCVYLLESTTVPGQARAVIYKGLKGTAQLIGLGSGNISNSPTYYPCAIMVQNLYIILVDADVVNPYYNQEVYNTSFVLQTTFNNFNLLNEQNYFLGYDHYGNLLSNSNYQGSSTSLNLFNNGTRTTFFSPPNGCVSLLTLQNAENEVFPGGDYDIFTYQQYLNKINEAFQDCFNQLKTEKGASFLPTEAPFIVYSATTKLFSLIVQGQYLTKNSDGSNQYTIFMNQSLWDKFFFPSSGPFQTYVGILLQNYGTNAVEGNGSAAIPQYISIAQEDSTIYAFYDLVRIIVGTTRIPVSGDAEGKTFSNSGFTSNNAINMITDIVPDTTTLTPGSILIYIPEGILRWYNLYAQQPFDVVDLILSYETKDGNIYTIDVLNGEFFSVKLEFKKGPGDF